MIKGRVKQKDALILLFTTRARVAASREKTSKQGSIYAVIAKNLSKDGGSVSTTETR